MARALTVRRSLVRSGHPLGLPELNARFRGHRRTSLGVDGVRLPDLLRGERPKPEVPDPPAAYELRPVGAEGTHDQTTDGASDHACRDHDGYAHGGGLVD